MSIELEEKEFDVVRMKSMRKDKRRMMYTGIWMYNGLIMD